MCMLDLCEVLACAAALTVRRRSRRCGTPQKRSCGVHTKEHTGFRAVNFWRRIRSTPMMMMPGCGRCPSHTTSLCRWPPHTRPRTHHDAASHISLSHTGRTRRWIWNHLQGKGAQTRPAFFALSLSCCSRPVFYSTRATPPPLPLPSPCFTRSSSWARRGRWARSGWPCTPKRNSIGTSFSPRMLPRAQVCTCVGVRSERKRSSEPSPFPVVLARSFLFVSPVSVNCGPGGLAILGPRDDTKLTLPSLPHKQTASPTRKEKPCPCVSPAACC